MKYIAATLLAIMPTLALAQNPNQPVQQNLAPGGVIHQTTEGLCLEPGHPNYNAQPPMAQHRTIRDCILAGGRRDIRTDTTDAQPSNQPTEPGMEPQGPIDPITGEPVDPSIVFGNGIDAEQAVEGLRNLNLTDQYGNTIEIENLTPIALLELRDLGMIPADFDVDGLIALMEAQSQIEMEEEQAASRSGPEEIKLPERPSFSESKSIFQSPESYISRSAHDFLP